MVLQVHNSFWEALLTDWPWSEKQCHLASHKGGSHQCGLAHSVILASLTKEGGANYPDSELYCKCPSSFLLEFLPALTNPLRSKMRLLLRDLHDTFSELYWEANGALWWAWCVMNKHVSLQLSSSLGSIPTWKFIVFQSNRESISLLMIFCNGFNGL